jgi:urate oxidase
MHEDNRDLVATDTQRNTVYVVAKRSKANTPEDFGIDLCKHFLQNYSMLTAVEIEVRELAWTRASVDNKPHEHSFIKAGSETPYAKVRMERTSSGITLTVASAIHHLVVLKTTQSGFSDHLKDKYTLLPDVEDRCLSTEVTATWRYVGGGKEGLDYGAIRNRVREQIVKGLFGPATGGVYSISLQATIYDAGCMVLSAEPAIQSIDIDTPNIHYIPFSALSQLGEKFENDIFVPTNEPSGSIHCTVSR